MGKDKKKNKNKNIDKEWQTLIDEYNESMELLKAKHKQLDGMIEELRLATSEVRNIKEQLLTINRKEDMPPLTELAEIGGD